MNEEYEMEYTREDELLKRISELEETINKLQVQNNWLEGCKSELAEHLGKANDKISELEQQIEKMKRCVMCKYHTSLGYCRIRQKGGVCENHDKWEIKEND